MPGDAGLLQPGQSQGRDRRLEDQGARNRQRLQGARRGRGVSAPEAGGRDPDDALRDAADRRAEPAARGRPHPDDLAGLRHSAAADGKRYPYLFPIAATYWSQGAAAIKFVKDKLGDLKGKKIAYVYYDNPAGKEPIAIIEDLQKREGFELRTFAVPPPGVELGAQALDITQRYKPDFIINHLFGRSPSVAIKEYKRLGYPLSR